MRASLLRLANLIENDQDVWAELANFSPADLNLAFSSNPDLLYNVYLNKNISLIRYLLELGVEPDKHGKQIVSEACRYNDIHILKLFIDYGYNLIFYPLNNYLLEKAISHGNIAVIKLIVRNVSEEIIGRDALLKLIDYVEQDNELLLILKNHPIRLSVEGSDNDDVIDVFFKIVDDPVKVELLLKISTKLNHHDGKIILNNFAGINKESFMILYKNNPELFDKKESSHICAAIKSWKTDLEFIKYLCNQNANLEQVNLYDETPLSCAVKYRKLEVVKFLLSRKVEVNNDLLEKPIIEYIVNFSEDNKLDQRAKEIIILLAEHGAVLSIPILNLLIKELLTHKELFTRAELKKLEETMLKNLDIVKLTIDVTENNEEPGNIVKLDIKNIRRFAQLNIW